MSVGWTPDSSRVVFQVQNREQYWLDINTVTTDLAAPNTIFRETTKAWVDPIGPPTWLKDGSFLWLSDRSGWRHVYRYAKGGAAPQQLTKGEWDIRAFHGIDEAGGWMYFSASERSPIGVDVYRARLDGSDMTRLTSSGGHPSRQLQPRLVAFPRFVERHSHAAAGPAPPVPTAARCACCTKAASRSSQTSPCRNPSCGLNYLKKQPWVDATRVGIDGWSFGGFMVTFAMTNSTSFAMGIAGDSVTDWRLYDSIYTERFMLMPQNNPEGYDRSSVLTAAKNLHGVPLLIHGVIDENVHAQNTMKLSTSCKRRASRFG